VLETYGRLYREMFQAAAALIAVSQQMRQQLINLGAQPEKVHWIPYGVDIDDFCGARPEAAGPGFLAVGRFVEKKAPHLTLLAFHQAHLACPEARLTMIGDGPLLPLCRQLARALDIAGAVTFPGALVPCSSQRKEALTSVPSGSCDVASVAAAMQQARAFVQHSVVAEDGDSEGTPVAVLEAQASGLPVVATRHAGIPDVVVEGQTGFLVAEQDVAGMAERMLRLARDPALAGDLGRGGRKRILDNFQLPSQINKLAAVISQPGYFTRGLNGRQTVAADVRRL
jgi:glycosyltransferase involved in cell wall biosynthesis